MTTHEAATLIGCSERHVRTLIRTGKLAAKPVVNPSGYGYCWTIPKSEAERFCRLPQSRGYPRGRKRSES